MPHESRTPHAGYGLYRTGWAMSGLVVAFLLMDAGMKLLALPVVLQAQATLGFEGEGIARGLGVILLACTLLYGVPQTAVLGAVLLTGYLGGAVAVKLRIGDPLFTNILFGVYVGVLVWGGIYLRDARLREILPLRSGTRSARLPGTPP
ncbi:MAG: DoxX family protein [Bradyrhizobium sp.]|nr:DoxX family protein [Bradyrhizobium sp.]